MKLADLYRWGYATPNSGLSFLTNVIHCQCGNKAAKMKGLHKLVTSGHDVSSSQFDIFKVAIDGKIYGIEILESPGLVKHWHDVAACA